MKKAQNLIEVSLILVLIVAVSLSLWPMFNNQKTKLANLSKSNVSTQSISGRQVQLKNNALELASAMGLTINPSDDLQTILDKIGQANLDKAKELAKTTGATVSNNAGIDTMELSGVASSSEFAQIASNNEKYTALVNEKKAIDASAVTINDNTTIAGAKGGRVSSTPIMTVNTPAKQEASSAASVPRTDFTGKNAYLPRPSQGEDYGTEVPTPTTNPSVPKTTTTGKTADSDVESSTYAIKTNGQ